MSKLSSIAASAARFMPASKLAKPMANGPPRQNNHGLDAVGIGSQNGGWLTMEEKHRTVGQAAANGGHQFTVVGREHLLLDGARNVISFSPEEVLLETTVGALVIKGQNLHIQQLNLDEGRVVVDGSFVSLTYAGENFSQKGKSFLHRMLR